MSGEYGRDLDPTAVSTEVMMFEYTRRARILALTLYLFALGPLVQAGPGQDTTPIIDGIAAEGFQLNILNPTKAPHETNHSEGNNTTHHSSPTVTKDRISNAQFCQ